MNRLLITCIFSCVALHFTLKCAADEYDLSNNFGRYLRENTHNLPGLASYAADGGIVVTSIFSRGYREIAANFMYSLVRFGQVHRVLMATFEESSLLECLSLGFICFDASGLLKESLSTNQDIQYGSAQYHKLMWTKPLVINALLQLNYNVLYSDLDTVWFKGAIRSMSTPALLYDADVVGMNDGNAGYPNAGNMFLKANNRTRRLLDSWLKEGQKGSGQSDGHLREDKHDQDGLRDIKQAAWDTCNSSDSCLKIRGDEATLIASVWLHPWHGCPWDNSGSNFCLDTKFAYLHIFCTNQGVPAKTKMAKELGLWFLHSDAASIHFRGARWDALIDYKIQHELDQKDPMKVLPCPRDALVWT
ncbi:hypothetical protein CEUSTIGMA_g10702.t1 [Chlamydomonas eustigma]|uniref:Glycosyltransferase n=1 Tax=Chlamydomonas eustigma TaxID=1157962 RepID=A0A250XJT5_9CHLO|nr:hypothetical protein CEUSTIGMA_g10702.t1 [Chlamydomonas eustigma]|eukprot:GAX83276.1 hypothetical protein CEUSTIGMA_g10702.t1 [Chlamydomonas eustigma]